LSEGEGDKKACGENLGFEVDPTLNADMGLETDMGLSET
jgi:hypothetical protein